MYIHHNTVIKLFSLYKHNASYFNLMFHEAFIYSSIRYKEFDHISYRCYSVVNTHNALSKR